MEELDDEKDMLLERRREEVGKRENVPRCPEVWNVSVWRCHMRVGEGGCDAILLSMGDAEEEEEEEEEVPDRDVTTI